MTIEFSCPGCEKVLKTSDDKAGRRAKCPQCGEPITVPAVEEPELFDDGFDLVDPESTVPEDQSFLSRPVSPPEIDCPMCGASNPHDALVCNYCGEVIRRTVNQKWEPNQIKVGEVFSRSWQLYTENLGLCIAVPFLAGLLSGVAVLALGLVGFAILMSMGAVFANNGPLAIIAAGGGLLIFIIALAIILNYLEAGMQIVLLKIALGEEAELGDLFTGGRFVLRLILCGLLFNLVVGFGNAIFFMIGLFLTLLFWPYPYLLIDRDLPGVEAFTSSVDLTKKNLLSMTLVFLAIIGIPVLLGIGLMVGGLMLIEVLKVAPLPVLLVGGIFVFIAFVFVYTFQLLVKAVAYRCMTRIE